MLLAFSAAVMACRARSDAYPERSAGLLLGIGAVMIFSGFLATVISRGDPFGLQHVLLGALVAWLGWRARKLGASVCTAQA
jgi:hypothetical protein